MELNPIETTVRDICLQALKECGAFGVGQTPLAEDLNDAQVRLQWMLQQWERKNFLIYHVVNYTITSTGAQFYSVGPGGDIDTGPGSVRPAKLISAFIRQLVMNQPGFVVGQTNNIDYPLELIKSRADYDKISLKNLVSFPKKIWYDPQWPLGVAFPWPVPQANIYAVGMSFMEQLPSAWTTASQFIQLPYEYFAAILYNLALRLRSKYGIVVPREVDEIKALAKDALQTIRSSNVQIPDLTMPAEMNRPGVYNVFSDQFY